MGNMSSMDPRQDHRPPSAMRYKEQTRSTWSLRHSRRFGSLTLPNFHTVAFRNAVLLGHLCLENIPVASTFSAFNPWGNMSSLLLQHCKIISFSEFFRVLQLASRLTFLKIVPADRAYNRRDQDAVSSVRLPRLKWLHICCRRDELVSETLLKYLQIPILERLHLNQFTLQIEEHLLTFLDSCIPHGGT